MKIHLQIQFDRIVHNLMILEYIRMILDVFTVNEVKLHDMNLQTQSAAHRIIHDNLTAG